MLVASILTLGPRDIKALRITDPYSLHRIVYSLYSDIRSDAEKQKGARSGFLYCDSGGLNGQRQVLLLADRVPQDNVDGYGRVVSKNVPENFLDCDRYRFSVVINPTKRDNQSGKLIPIKGVDAIRAWFGDRAQQSWGFNVEGAIQIAHPTVLRFKEKHGREATVFQVKVAGLLTVNDRTRFRHSFTNGLGRAKSFGCGLLQLSPIL